MTDQPLIQAPTTQGVRDEAYDLLAKAEAVALTIRQTMAQEDAGSALAARIAVLFEQVEWACHRATDRCRTDPVLADAFVRRARMALWDLQEEAEPPLTEAEQREAWQMLADQLSDESTKDRVRNYMDAAGKLGIREELAEYNELIEED